MNIDNLRAMWARNMGPRIPELACQARAFREDAARRDTPASRIFLQRAARAREEMVREFADYLISTGGAA